MALLISLLLVAAPHRAAAVVASKPAPTISAPAAEEEWSGVATDNGKNFAARLLASHNAERARLRLAPLRWSADLAAQAALWASVLAKRKQMSHSPDSQRPGQGENLFTGTAGAYSLEDMVGDLIDEKADFRPGIFPKVAIDGNWHNVGHYTQIIWRKTREVGCAVASGGGDDYLVCRYFPAGNMIGEAVP